MVLLSEISHHPYTLFFEIELVVCQANLVRALTNKFHGSFYHLPSAMITGMTTMLGLYSAGERIQDFRHSRQAL